VTRRKERWQAVIAFIIVLAMVSLPMLVVTTLSVVLQWNRTEVGRIYRP
jgi:hypothetical protein